MKINLKALYEAKSGYQEFHPDDEIRLFYGDVISCRDACGDKCYEIVSQLTGEILCSDEDECTVINKKNYKILKSSGSFFCLRNDEFTAATGIKTDAPEESMLKPHEDLLYWSNSCGELHHHGEYDIEESELPKELQQAYNNLWSDAFAVRCYLAEYKGQYGVLLQATFDECYAKDIGLSYDELYSFVKGRAELLAEMLRNTEYIAIFEIIVSSDGSVEIELSIFVPYYKNLATVLVIAAKLERYACSLDVFNDCEAMAEIFRHAWRMRIEECDVFSALMEAGYFDDYDSNCKKARFTSVWEDGTEITTNCMVNMQTHEIFDMPPTGFSLEDYTYMREHIEAVESAMSETGCEDLTEAEKDYLITSQIMEPEKELTDMIDELVEAKEPKDQIWMVTATADHFEPMLVCIATTREMAARKVCEHNEQYAKVFGKDEAECIEYITTQYKADVLISTIMGGK